MVRSGEVEVDVLVVDPFSIARILGLLLDLNTWCIIRESKREEERERKKKKHRVKV